MKTWSKGSGARQALLGGISVCAVIAAVPAEAIAAEATNIYGIYGDAAVTTGEAGRVFVLENDRTLTVGSGLSVEAGQSGATGTNHYGKIADTNGLWTTGNPGTTTLSVPVNATDSILTKADNTGTVILQNGVLINGNVGSTTNALKKVVVNTGNSGSTSADKPLRAYALDINGKGTFYAAGLASSGGGSTAVTFNDNATLLLSASASYIRMSATASRGGTAGLGKIIVRGNGGGDIVFNGLGDSTNYLAQVAIGSATNAKSNGPIYSAATIIDTNDSTPATLTGNGSPLTLGRLIYFVDYNTGSDTVLLGNVTNSGGLIDISGLIVSPNDDARVGNGLSTLWDRRATDDDAVNLGKVLQYGTLKVNGQNVLFNGQKYVGSGTTYTAARTLAVQKVKLAAWNFALAEQGGGTTTPGEAYLLLVRNINGFTEASSGSGLSSHAFGGIAEAMNTIAGTGTALSNFLDGLTTTDVPVAAQQMVNNAVNNQISNTIATVAGVRY